jgi:shikimate dehydrogenase
MLQEAAFAALGLDWRAERVEVGRGGGAALVERMRREGIRGLSVTMPLKEEVADAADRLVGDAVALASVNCLSLEGDEVVGLSTDGEGFVAALRRSLDVELDGLVVTVLGAGGAARAVGRAAAVAGASQVGFVARDHVAAARAAGTAGPVGRVVGAADALASAVIVNATPVGMAGTPAADARPLVDATLLGAGTVAVDLVYHPRTTRWLEDAQRAGARTEGGLGMLVHQAALQIERWTGMAAPVEAMWAAVAGELEARGW